MKINKLKLVYFCDSIVLFSIYAIAFFLPISKALIESFVLLAFLFYFIKKIINKEGFPRSWFNLTLLIYVIVCLVSIFISTNFKISAKTFSFKLLENVIFLLVVIDTLNSKNRIKNMLYVFFISSALLGLDGIFQYFTRQDFLRKRPVIFYDRIYASFATPNAFGCFLITMIPYALTQIFVKFRIRWFKLVWMGLSLLLVICLILTASRGAWFAFMGSVLFMSVWLPYLGLIAVSFLILIVPILKLYNPFLNERIRSFFLFSDAGAIDRKVFWQVGWDMFQASPWVGLGLGTFMFNYREFLADKTSYIAYAHNCYLQILAEIGIVGLFTFLLILISFFYRGVRLLIFSPREFNWYLLLASLASLLGYCIQMGVDTIFYSLDLGLLFWLIMGFGVAIMNDIEPKRIAA